MSRSYTHELDAMEHTIAMIALVDSSGVDAALHAALLLGDRAFTSSEQPLIPDICFRLVEMNDAN